MFKKLHRGFACKFLSAAILTFLFVVPAAAFDAAQVSDIYYRAITAGEPVPILDIADADKTEANAYKTQALFVEKLLARGGASVVGYKAGLTTEAQMRRFGAPGPVMGPLFKSGLIEALDSRPVTIVSFKGIMLENEFAFKTAKPITARVKDEAELKGCIASVHPAIEIPQLNFSDMSKLGFFDLTAAGVGSKLFIIGRANPVNADFDAMKAVMERDGTVVNEGMGSEVLGGQWTALLRLVNGVLEQGGKIEAGQYFLTGALGKMIPAEPGEYRAEYPIGIITFTVKGAAER